MKKWPYELPGVGTDPVLEEDIPEILRQSRNRCIVPRIIHISLDRNASIEFFRPVLDGLKITEKPLARLWVNFFRFLTQTTLSTVRAGTLPRGHLRVYSTEP